ncbi:MAG: hypothetical protein SFV23_11990 [Planctomycetaceae bacterium]|nr:hypothetical protein [Planctomycetaceae bacterium]
MAQVHYMFTPEVPLEEVDATLRLALLAAQSLHGCDRVGLEAQYRWERADRTCVIDGGTAVGRDLNCLFAGFIRREFGAKAFQVDRVESATTKISEAGT